MSLKPRPRRNVRRCVIENLDVRRLLAAADAGMLAHDDSHDHDHHNALSITYFPESVVLRSDDGFLTGRQTGRRADLARQFVAQRAADFGLQPADVQSAVITDQYTDSATGITHVYMQQTINGLPVQNTSLGIHFTRDGRVISAASSFVADLNNPSQNITQPTVSGMLHPSLALRAAADALEIAFPTESPRLALTGGEQLSYSADSVALSLDPIEVRAQYIASATGVNLAWKLVMRLPDGSNDWYDLSVDARTGEVIFAHNWKNDASYNIYPAPLESPADGARQVVADPHDLTASPFGWHDTNGVVGAEFTDTRGNNVSAQDDADSNNSGGTRPSGGAALTFDATIDLALAPAGYRDAATLNLFYWNNLLHDVHYQYGFTEAAGNFQTNTYGRGGTGNDAVQADAQDAADVAPTSTNRNNANFATPPDGSAGRMQMYIFTSTTPNRDGDLDAGIIAHEYGHGVSNRLTGGPANASALQSTQSRGMGEGWSDFYALMFTQVAADQPTDAYPMGTYALGQPSTGPGIRRRPYSFDKNIDPLTFEAYGTSGTTSYGISRSTQVHNTGELWASTLWDLNWLLVGKHGFDGNLASGYSAAGTPAQQAGNKLAMQLVMDGMKLQPANTSFVQARDAILSADLALTGGDNTREIWLAFARRGLGTGASTSSATSTTLTPSFDVPTALFDPLVTGSTPSGGTQLAPLDSFSFTFSEAVDPTSFSIADDVQAFTGPGGVDLLAAITSAAFSNGNKTLTIGFTAAAQPGAYSMTVGPNILAVDNNAAMDQNVNGIVGEAADAFTTSYTYQRYVGPDSAGYSAAEYPHAATNLVAGAPGVTTLVNGTDDSNALLTLPAGSTFNFYGTSYTSMSVSDNGLIAFGGTATTNVGNSDFGNSPATAAIAALYDDWRTDTNSGAVDSNVLYTLNGSQLTIEWSEVPNFNATGSPATFQAVLQLNTGAVPGRIIVNYIDLTVGSISYDNGASATLGIKNVGAQGPAAVVVSKDISATPWLRAGKSVLFALDVEAPTVASAAFNRDAGPAVHFGFSEAVTTAAGAFTINNLTTSQVLLAAGVTNPTADAAVVSLPNTLADGNYRATIAGGLIGASVNDASGNPLDGDLSGVAGGAHTFDFFFLRGDANGDRTVNLDDFTALAANFGQTRVFSQGDFNYDGGVTLDDFTILAAKFGETLPLARTTAGQSSGNNAFALPARAPRASFQNDRVIGDVLPNGILTDNASLTL